MPEDRFVECDECRGKPGTPLLCSACVRRRDDWHAQRQSRTAEKVNHPPHYQSASGIEAIDVIEGFGLGFNLGNSVKYLLRAGHKGDTLIDLRKARWYLDREIAKLEERKEP